MLMVQTDQRHPQLGNGLLLRLHFPQAHGVGNAPFTVAFLVALFVQQTLGYTPLQAGLIMLPGTAVMGIAGLLVGRLADAIEPGVILAVGLTSLALVGYVFSLVVPLTTAVCC
jgi:MFS transporter, DHA2 family, lincomycin resistance protein